MKDVPDAAGDAKFNIRSFTVRIGQKSVFTSMRKLLTVLFFGVGTGFARSAIEAFKSSASITTLGICRCIVALSAFGAGISVRQEAQDVNAEDSGEVYNYYMHLWKLFYASYLILPFAR
jgi:homogentisate phytyltransferase/homogentisate geranylgeranyltransferase